MENRRRMMSRNMRWVDFLVLLPVLLPCIGTAGAAELRGQKWLKDKDDLTFVMVGREIGGVYANGVSFTETYRRSGLVEYRDAKNALTGTWTVKDGSLCTAYDQGASGCFRIMMVSENCIEYWPLAGDGSTVSSSWIARGWRTKNPPTCIQ
jgi:hypothetical protein